MDRSPPRYAEARKMSGLPLRHAAERLNCDVDYLRDIEHGREIPGERLVSRMADVYMVRSPWIEGENTPREELIRWLKIPEEVLQRLTPDDREKLLMSLDATRS